MHCILCTIVKGEPKLLEHQAAQWLTKETLRNVKWLPADELLLPAIKRAGMIIFIALLFLISLLIFIPCF